jgi:transposase-like protein
MMRKMEKFRRGSMRYRIKRGIFLQKERRKMEKAEKLDKRKQDKAGRRASVHTAEEKCRAVLSVWTEKRRAGVVCRELGIAWALLNQWQGRAMEGMLLALGPRVQVEKGVALPPRLAVLLEQKSKGGAMRGLDRRLARLQGTAIAKALDSREVATEKKV